MSFAFSSSFDRRERGLFWFGGGTMGVKMSDGGSRREYRLNGEATVSGMACLLCLDMRVSNEESMSEMSCC